VKQRRTRWILLAALVLAAIPLGAWLGGLQAQPASPIVAATEDVHFHFVQISDLHFGPPEHFERNRDVVKRINALPMDLACVLVTGDVFSDGILNDALRKTAVDTLNGLEPPIHYVPGNHDIVRKSGKLKATTEAWTRDFGPLASKAEHHGVVFLMVYTEPLAKSFEQPGFDPLAWLEAELKAAGEKPVIIVHHTPSVPDFYRNRMHEGWKLQMRRQWERLVNSANVKGVIAGHFHRAEQHWVGDVPLYVAPSVAGFWGRQGSYRIYEYRNGRLAYRTQYLE
jgi:3',5'-cyclic AMP phosphodiesterase CpdA